MKQSNRRLNREWEGGRQRTGSRAAIIDKLKKQNIISLQLNKFFKKRNKAKITKSPRTLWLAPLSPHPIRDASAILAEVS